MAKRNVYYSRAYWENYIDSIILAIKEDRDTIIDMLVYGELDKAKIIMNLSKDIEPTYKIVIDKTARKSPFGEEDDE